jgi:release factor glutamine methyltransferase
MPSIKTLLNQPIDSLDAEVLLAYVLKKPREYLFVNQESRIKNQEAKKFLALVKKRQLGWPVAYLTQKKEFFGLNFFVNKHVLIPRPETEGLVELILSRIKNQESGIKILDIGTGSGNIIIALAKTISSLTPHPSPLFCASDISPKALLVAKKNAKNHGVKITFKQGDLLAPWKNKNFDIIVANLPYGWNDWKNNTSAETIGLKFEPKQVLFTSKHGLFIIENLFKQIALRNNSPRPPLKFKRGWPTKPWRSRPGALSPKFIFLEFDPRQTSELKKLATKWLPDYKLKISKDLARRARYAVISQKPF